MFFFLLFILFFRRELCVFALCIDGLFVLFGCRLDPQMLETMFGVLPIPKKDASKNVSIQKKAETVTILDARKAHNFAIQQRALGMRSIEVCEALLEGKFHPPNIFSVFVAELVNVTASWLVVFQCVTELATYTSNVEYSIHPDLN